MKTVIIRDDLAVFDDVLDGRAFGRFVRFFEQQDFRHVHSEPVAHIWRPRDGNPFTSTVMALVADSELSGEPADPTVRYPTNTPLDLVLDAIVRRAQRLPRVVGRRGKDWDAVGAKLYLYPVGTGLSWHRDDRVYSGAFIYYAHPRWNASWGGELMVMEGVRLLGRRRALLGHEEESRQLMRTGLGTFVAPKPNRLVYLRGGTPHMIAPVSSAAGENLRATVSGFFAR